MTDRPTLVWFAQDLRLVDNPALAAAVEAGRPIVPVFVLDDETPGAWRPGAAARWWLHHSLAALSRDLAGLGAPLVLRRGEAATAILDLAAETGAAEVVWNRVYEPAQRLRNERLKADLATAGIRARSFNASLLVEPWELRTTGGAPYQVFSPFWRACRARIEPGPAPPRPRRFAGWTGGARSDALDDWALCPTRPDWAGGLRAAWRPGEAGAGARLAGFLDSALAGYRRGRDRPDQVGTSMLSPHLHWGEIGPRQVWRAIHAHVAAAGGAADADGDGYLRELGWREFSYHLLFHFPDLPALPLRDRFDDFPWRGTKPAIAAWRAGRTGYPIVDAGMRQLWHTGWMHNRVRMIVASFLIKDLLVPWQTGEAWFWDTLVDADLACNAANWQWVAGCGADAAPYFRIFNPVLQGERFDPEGTYVRAWVPELARLPASHIHKPWLAPDAVLDEAGIRLGETYPTPIVDHGEARRRALDAFAQIRDEAG